MKKLLAILLTAAMLAGFCTTALAALPQTFTFDLSAQGDYADPHNIEAAAGETITVVYRLTADDANGVSALTQNEIGYDSSFFTLVNGSIAVTDYGSGMTCTPQQRTNGECFVYFNNGNPKYFDNGPDGASTVIGTFRLTVKPGATGTGLVQNCNYGAVSGTAEPYNDKAYSLKVTVAGTAATVPVASVSLNKPYLTLKPGETATLSATVSPADATDPSLTWTSSNPSVATVANGVVTAVKDGNATVTVKTQDGGKTATCAIDVESEAPQQPSTPSTPTTPPTTETPTDTTPVTQVPEVTTPVIVPGSTFTDVKSTDYFKDAVSWAAANGVTTGTDATHFSPAAPTTRGQVVTFLWRAAGSPAASHTAAQFKDLDADKYYVRAVEWAVEQGITNGTSATTFSPETTCTRGQIVTFLYRFAKAAATGGANPFTDVAAKEFYYDPVLWAVANGITNGTGAATFSPEATCNRGQVVTFLYRWMVR